MRPRLISIARIWIPLAVAITGLSGLTYAAVQQNYRQSLNDPQIQMAENTAVRLCGACEGSAPKDVIPPDMVPEVSLAPWLAVFDSTGALIASNSIMLYAPDAQAIPSGLFKTDTWLSSKRYAMPGWGGTAPLPETRVTWEARDGTREALVIIRSLSGDFVVAGRNMREVEQRESDLTAMVGLGWLVTMGATLVASTALVLLL